jgi:hypothetical protein
VESVQYKSYLPLRGMQEDEAVNNLSETEYFRLQRRSPMRISALATTS